jgi:hypothetical protein
MANLNDEANKELALSNADKKIAQLEKKLLKVEAEKTKKAEDIFTSFAKNMLLDIKSMDEDKIMFTHELERWFMSHYTNFRKDTFNDGE